MKSFEFNCGGDRGAWETLVDVSLTDEEAFILKQFAKENDILDRCALTESIWSKVMDALKDQCDEDADLSTTVIWVPFGIKDDV